MTNDTEAETETEMDVERAPSRRVIITKVHRYDPPDTTTWHREFKPGPDPIRVPGDQYESLMAANACVVVDDDAQD